jgi:hypothetical protein
MKVELSNNEDTEHYSELTRDLVAAGGRTQWLIESRKFTVCGDPKFFATNVIGPLRLIAPLVAALGRKVIVANARKLRAISESQTKNDEEDAEMLTRLGRAHRKLLCPVQHRSEPLKPAAEKAARLSTGRPFRRCLSCPR